LQATDSNSSQCDSKPWSGTGLGVKVCLGLRALSFVLGMGPLSAPCAHVCQQGSLPLVLGQLCVLSSFPPLSEDSQLFVWEPKTARRAQTQFQRTEVNMLCGNHQFKGDEFSCPPSLVVGESGRVLSARGCRLSSKRSFV
jgi:hypothetical protein